MKFAVLFILLIVASIGANASDVSCQTEIMKPPLGAVHIIEEDQKPAELTVAETQLRLKEANLLQASEDEQLEHEETIQMESKKVTAKKQSRLGGIFDILLPSKLRNPVK